MKKQFLFFAIMLMALVTGCKKENGVDAPTPTNFQIKKVDMSNAKLLALVDNSPNGTKAGSESGRVLKLSSTGNLADLAVTLADSTGKEMICGISAKKVTPMTAKYALLQDVSLIYPEGYTPPTLDPYKDISLLARVSDGVVYVMPTTPIVNISVNSDICQDDKGNIYFINVTSPGALMYGTAVKMTVENDVKLTEITLGESSLGQIMVDKSGNVIVSGGVHRGADPNNTTITKSGTHSMDATVYFAGGGSRQLKDPNNQFSFMRNFFSIDGRFAKMDIDWNKGLYACNLEIDKEKGFNFIDTVYCPLNIGSITASIGEGDFWLNCRDKFINTQTWEVKESATSERKKKTAVISFDGKNLSYKLEELFPYWGYYNDSKFYAIDGFSKFGQDVDIENSKSADERAVGRGMVYKYDFASLAVSKTTYDIDAIPAMTRTGTEVMIFDNNCKFIAYGIRQSDSKPIIVMIDAESGKVEIVETDSQSKIINMTRVN